MVWCAILASNIRFMVPLVLVPILWLAFYSPWQAFAAEGQQAGGLRFKFEGLTLSPSPRMTEGALNGWHEDEWIPMRLMIINEHASQTVPVSVLLEYMKGARIGLDAFGSCFSDSATCGSGSAPSSGANWQILTGSDEISPSVDLVEVAEVAAIRWTLASVSVPEGNPSNPSIVELKWAVHLAKSGANNLLCSDSSSSLKGCSPNPIAADDGAKSWPGNSLQVRLDQPPGQRTLSIDPPREQQQTGQRCIIATAAFGSELAAPVQFLRDFRDHEVSSTMTGAAFIHAFNNWYYSWAPPAARLVAGNEHAKLVVRTLIVPSLGALMIGHQLFGLIHPINSDVAIIVAGLASSSIIGTIYLTPVAYLVKRACRRSFGRATIVGSLALGLVLAIYGTLGFRTLGVLENFSSILVLEVLLLTPTVIVTRLSSGSKEKSAVQRQR